MKIVKRNVSPDRSIKYVFETNKKHLVEAVYFKFLNENGKDIGRALFNPYIENRRYPDFSICISSQAGCAMACKFCATGYGGFFGNLHAEEMQQQVDLIYQDLMDSSAEQVGAKGNIVMMGMGEPLMNYQNVVEFCYIVQRMQKKFIKLMTISTIGIIPNIEKLSFEEIPVKLYFSIHSPFEDERNTIMPIGKTYPLMQAIKACENYSKIRQSHVVACYLLLNDMNDSEQHALALASLLSPEFFQVQLLTFNPITEINYKRSDRIEAFAQILREKSQLIVDIRISKGQEIQAGCGQLVQQLYGKTINKH